MKPAAKFFMKYGLVAVPGGLAVVSACAIPWFGTQAQLATGVLLMQTLAAWLGEKMR